MKTICALMLTAALGAVGCTTTSNSIGGNKYTADEPLVEGKATEKGAVEPANFGPPVSRLDPQQDVTEDNSGDVLRRLQSDIKTDRSAMSKAGR